MIDFTAVHLMQKKAHEFLTNILGGGTPNIEFCSWMIPKPITKAPSMGQSQEDGYVNVFVFYDTLSANFIAFTYDQWCKGTKEHFEIGSEFLHMSWKNCSNFK